jgi:hypothetical protein
MRTRLIILPLLGLALAIPQASAQPERRDHRERKPAPRDNEKVPAKRAAPAPQVTSFAPADGPAGTTVTIRGQALEGATVTLGRQTVKATGGPRQLTFEVPRRIRTGSYPILIKSDRGEVTAGTFKVTRERAEPPAAEPPAAEPPASPPVRRPPPRAVRPNERVPARRAHRERPAVTSYWPAKGDVGTKVTIRGTSFGPNAIVIFGDTEVKPDQLTADRIVFTVPRGRKDATVAVRMPALRRDLVVGTFEVTRFDAKAERERRDKERRKAAQEAWKKRQKELAKDRAERERLMREREAELARTRAERRAARQAELRAKWEAAFLVDSQTLSELALHAERKARLQRMLRLAEAGNHGELVVRINVLIGREDDRHDRRMGVLRASFQLN